MKIEEVYAPESIDGSEGLLAIILRGSPWSSLDDPEASEEGQQHVQFVTDPSMSQQVAVIRYGDGAEVPAHVHLPQARTTRGTQEVLVVRRGVLRLCVYTSAGELVATKVLTQGQVAVLVAGGHSLKALTDAEIIEVKNGPYYGRERDKVSIKVAEVKL